LLFLVREKRRQESFRRLHWPELENGHGGTASGRTRPSLLPRGHEAKAFYPPAAEEILDYCRGRRIPILAAARDLRSSLVACLNILFPLRQNPALATLALEQVLPGLAAVQRIEFLFPAGEETEKGELSASSRPRADAATWWLDVFGRRCLSLICLKYTETNYGTCGGFRSRKNTEQRHCLQMNLNDPQQTLGCYLYRQMSPWLPWDRLAETGIRLDMFHGVCGCPFRGPFYQVMREFALAAALRRTEDVDHVDVVFVGFRGNRRLTRTPVHLAPLGNDLIRAWNLTLEGVPKLRYVFAEEIVAGLRRDCSGIEDNLVTYLAERYGL